jgi:hypothetical protein
MYDIDFPFVVNGTSDDRILALQGVCDLEVITVTTPRSRMVSAINNSLCWLRRINKFINLVGLLKSTPTSSIRQHSPKPSPQERSAQFY